MENSIIRAIGKANRVGVLTRSIITGDMTRKLTASTKKSLNKKAWRSSIFSLACSLCSLLDRPIVIARIDERKVDT